MENLEAFILVAGGLAVAFAFGWTAICTLIIPVMARASEKIDDVERLAGVSHISGPPPVATMAGEPAGPDIGRPGDDPRHAGLRVGSAVVIDLQRWKHGASGAPIGSAPGAQGRKVSDRKTAAGVGRN
jgi:hypothetical protein